MISPRARRSPAYTAPPTAAARAVLDLVVLAEVHVEDAPVRALAQRLDGDGRELREDRLAVAAVGRRPRDPLGLQPGRLRLRRLQDRAAFPDFEAVEMDYYRQYGIFPIMHLLTVKNEVVQDHPWAAASIAAAFSAAKRIALDRLRDPPILPLAFWQSAIRR